MLNLQLNKFANSGTCCSKETHNKVPFHIILLLQLILQKCIISITDYILQIGSLLNFNGFKT